MTVMTSSRSVIHFDAAADDKPVRASKRSAEWCLKSVEKCWKEKKKFIAESEAGDAVAAYEHARKAYRQILEESEVD